MSKPKLLWVSDNPNLSFVGQSIVARQMLDRLKKDYEVQAVGYGKVDNPRWGIGTALDYPVHEARRYDDKRLLEVVQQFKPDIMLCSHDIFMFATLKLIKQHCPETRIVGWFTVDGDPLPPVYRQVFTGCDMIVSPTQYGADVIKKQFYDVAVKVIPYGINHSAYMPNSRPQALKQLESGGVAFAASLTQKLANPETFISIFWGHNQSKKNIPAIVKAWKQADIDVAKSHLLLVLHSHEVTKGQITTLGDWDYTSELDIETANHITLIDSSFRDEVMSRMVQLADTVLFPSIGEGFGLPPLEGMACGAVPITSNFAGVKQFCKHGHNSLLLGGEMVSGEFGIGRIFVSAADLKSKIEKAYQMSRQPQKAFTIQPAYFDDMMAKPAGSPLMTTWLQMKQNALLTSHEYTWEKAAKQWHELLQKLMRPEFGRNLVHVSI